jgi:hypothetical protein
VTHQLATSFKSLGFFSDNSCRNYMHIFFKDEVQWLLKMAGCCKSGCGTVVHTGAVTRYDFPSNISLRYAFVKNLMMWTRDVIRSRQPAKISGNSSCQRWLLFLFKKNNERKFIKYQQYNVVRVSTDQHVYVCRSLQTRYDYNLTIMKSQVSQTGYWQQV